MTQPLISIVILTYKRQAALLQTIEAALRQEYENFEIIVVDNHSEDGTTELVQKKFPQVRLIVMAENSGCAGRNAGFSAAKGEILVSIDNDISFDSLHELQKIVTFFDARPRVACITFCILQPPHGKLSVRDWCHPRSYWGFADKAFPTYYIAEGACAFRKSIIEQTGGYDPRFFINHEGFDLALRIFRLGYEIYYTPEVKVWHDEASGIQKSWRPYFYNSRNYLFLAWKHFRPFFGLRFLAPRIVMLLLFAARTGNLRYYFKGLVAGIKERRGLMASRVPMPKSVERQLREMLSYRPGLFFWLRRHKKKPLL
ncbi:MAG: glycosyltransferase family 2 protein [candidate division KSB1 bacterium]|nr:glycosyltransferase family 2 protein [candidate division KSB1 bacterium]